jgi:GST-like protein
MIDLHYWPTPNGKKISILLEELDVPYKIQWVDMGKGEQFKPEFLDISPNNRIPAMVDHAPLDGGAPISIFESGAILLYLAQKYGQFYSDDVRQQQEINQWLFWQMGGLGPMAGQAHHFRQYAPEQVPYGIERYTNECNRLYGVLNRRLADREFIAEEYSIADMACWPWVLLHERQGQDIAQFPHVKRWIDTIQARPAAAKGEHLGDERRTSITDEASRKVLFNQTAR